MEMDFLAPALSKSTADLFLSIPARSTRQGDGEEDMLVTVAATGDCADSCWADRHHHRTTSIFRCAFSMLLAVSMAGAAWDGVIVVVVSGGGKRKSKGLRIVVIIEVVRERSLSLVFGRLEVDRNLNRNSFLMMMT